MKKCNPFVGFWHYGVILTYLSLASAVVGICFSVGGAKEPYPWVGVVCLLISGLCDAFDGIVARTRKNRTREDCMFGERIDSLADLVAFGVAPAMIGYNSIPLPGGSGAFEFLYINIYALAFSAEFTLIAMMVTRVISYYLSMLVNGIYTVLYHVLAKPAGTPVPSEQTTSNEKDGTQNEKM